MGTLTANLILLAVVIGSLASTENEEGSLSRNSVINNKLTAKTNSNQSVLTNDNNSDSINSEDSYYERFSALWRPKSENCSWWFNCPSSEATTVSATSAVSEGVIDIDNSIASENGENINHVNVLHRITRETNENDDDEKISPKDELRRSTVSVDDEDFNTQGDASGDRLYGSGDVSLPPATVPSFALAPTQPMFLRLVFKLHEPYKKEYKNQTSPEYKTLENEIHNAFNNILIDLPGRRPVTLINVREIESEPFYYNVTVNVQTAGFYDTQEILSRIRRHIQTNGKFESLMVASGDFTYSEFGATGQCRPEELPCRSGECLNASLRCNSVSDCKDGSDEEGCPDSWETSKSFNAISGTEDKAPASSLPTPTIDRCRADDKVRCSDGSVFICEDQLCDGVPNCKDGSDELNCPKTECNSDEFMCDVTRCIPKRDVCNKVLDCTDGTDEKECDIGATCRDDEFQCRDGKCIKHYQRCNYERDCLNGEDEVDCACPQKKFDCRNDSSSSITESNCINIEQRCDGHKDCPNGADEFNCSTSTSTVSSLETSPLWSFCGQDDWQCASGDCINKRQRCNGRRDCPRDASDEQNCPSTPGSVQVVCSSSEFLCRNGHCIPGNLRCNKETDCSDNSDEQSCPCAVNEFECANGHCIAHAKRCDGLNHCQDGSDEINCPFKCGPNEFRCRNESLCLPLFRRCDRRPDCSDGSDEEGCSRVTCSVDQFRCSDGSRCLNIAQRCDTINDCIDSSDEENCGGACPETDFACRDGSCISGSQRCDGRRDCPDNSDETNCIITSSCPESDYSCLDGPCVPLKFRCDGIEQCQDGSDELSCPTIDTTSRPACRAREFSCRDGSCISATFVCDTIPDCLDESDESDCANICASGDFRCHDGYCVPENRRCDGARDCRDGSDEELCGCREFLCDNGLCLPNSVRCDSYRDCTDGSDERDCGSKTCATNEFQCINGECVREAARCDGIPDCSDRSDEVDCGIQDENDDSCPRDWWACDGGLTCVASSHKCDTVYDCRDFSDEQNCVGCRAGEFQCRNGQCIPSSKVCNTVPDCRDNSDESHCSEDPNRKSCLPGQFACHSGTQCIPQGYHCDTRDDCADASDELNCDALRCPQNFWRCENGPCIPNYLRCNGRNDCPFDVSDELDCVSGAPRGLNLVVLPKEQTIKEGREVVFQCRDEGFLRAPVKWRRVDKPLPPGYRDVNGRLEIPNIQMEHAGSYICEAVGYPESTPGQSVMVFLKVEPSTYPIAPRPAVCGYDEATCNNRECIKKSQICDGHIDCRDGSDEVRCQRELCEPNQFRCRAGQCVQKDWVCDGQDDCMDYSDEADCQPPANSSCLAKEFECNSRVQCIPLHMLCDGEIDCQDASDEIRCIKPSFTETPPAMVTVDCSSSNSIDIVCTAVGGPTPFVSWRRNWGHIPNNCKQNSVNGKSHLICTNIRESEQGAYSCEAFNNKGHIFATPDTQILCRVDQAPSLECPIGTFNAQAIREDECINCFCFGKSTQCSSANLFTYQVPPPFTQYRIIAVDVTPDGNVQIRADTSLRTPTTSLYSVPNGFQMYSRSKIERLEFSGSLIPYFVLPEIYQRNQLKSFGGYLKYSLKYGGNGRPIRGPDVILVGNGITLVHTVEQHTAGQEHPISIRFWPRVWQRQGSRRGEESPASREDIMLVLADVQYILLRAQYVDGEIIDTTISEVKMDSAGVLNVGLGKAAYVEKCECPVGYQGLSCEECSSGYERRPGVDPWRGSCEPEEDILCPSGTYKNSFQPGAPCIPCPCPLTNPSNQFGSCSLAGDGQVTCNCPPGYSGRRCERCEYGYTGNPNIPGDSCRRSDICNIEGSVTSSPDSQTGVCICKNFTTGRTCDRCKASHFYLSSQNSDGCISCFCSGVTGQCDSSSLYRDQITVVFVRDAQNFRLGDAESGRTVDAAIHVDTQTRELVFQGFSPRSPQVYYWYLPSIFLGDKITSYGGFLTYTIRYVPTPGGQSSRNSAPDVQLISANHVTLSYFHREAIEPNRPVTVRVPLIEKYWQRQDGQTTNREHFLMALADLENILIKGTYTTNTKEAALIKVTLDVATERNTGQPRALDVEDCQCPVGYRGTSCEDCDVGYTRTGGGLYLGLCEPCNCNRHSIECDPELGTCLNCANGTRGENCDECLDGYKGNPFGEGCTLEETSQCKCDERGSISRVCNAEGDCLCKANVAGRYCDRCRSGFFGLPEAGYCISCFCSGVTSDCVGSSYNRIQIPMQILKSEANHGFTITDSQKRVVTRTAFSLTDAKNEITYSNLSPGSSQTLYWSLPVSFTGNKVLSYGGKLTLTQRFEGSYGRENSEAADIILSGNGITLYWKKPSPYLLNELNTFEVPLSENSWVRADSQGPRSASRTDFLSVLANIESIQILATPFSDLTATHLSDVAMDFAVEHVTGYGKAPHVELCRCPPGYRGTSCELCAPGYYRDTYDRTSPSAFGLCKRCPCNSREESCVLEANGRVLCSCRPGYTGRTCETEGSSRPDPSQSPPISVSPTRILISIAEPTIRITQLGSNVHFHCKGTSIESGKPVKLQWQKEGGILPPGRAIDDSSGLLVITSVQEVDAGVYTCIATDGIDIITEHATIQIESKGSTNEAPRIQIQPTELDVREGDPVEFRCVAVGIPLPSLRWLPVDGSPLNPRFSYNNGIFSIPQAIKSDEGSYACLATNPAGEASAIARLTVRSGLSSGSSIKLQVSPNEYSGPETDILTFTCGPNRWPLTWTRSSQRLPANAYQRDGVLTLYNPTVADSGVYICTGTDPVTGATATAQTRVYISPSKQQITVLITPEEQHVPQGEAATLRCVVHGSTTNLRPVWSRLRDEKLPAGAELDASGQTLRFPRISVSDRGTYVCTVDTVQAMARLEVEAREPPLVDIHPETFLTVTEGGSVLFHCLVKAGTPSPRLRWSKPDGSPIYGKNVVEEPNGVLRINEVSVADEGSFVCHADNIAGSVSATASIEVLIKPKIEITPPDRITLIEGEPLRLECRARGKPNPAVSWLRYTLRAPQQIYELKTLTDELPTSVLYSISAVRKSDEGTYACMAKNSAGSDQERVVVIVDQDNNLPNRGDIPRGGEDGHLISTYESPGFQTQTSNSPYTVSVGGRTEIRCSLQVTNEVVYLDWKRTDGRSISSEHTISNGVLRIQNAQPADAGEYICLGSNRSGQILFRALATLAVIQPPRITLNPTRQVVQPGDNPSITCSATGDEPISIVWSAVGRELPRNSYFVRGLLQFRRISVSDAGKYLCTATNPAGVAEATAEVAVLKESTAPEFGASVLAEKREHYATEGGAVQLRCAVSADQGGRQPEVIWRKEPPGTPLPSNAEAMGEVLRLTSVRVEDSGRYTCEIAPQYATDGRYSDYIDLSVNRARQQFALTSSQSTICRQMHFRCRSYPYNCIPLERYCDQKYDCRDGSDESGCRSGRGAEPPSEAVLSIQSNPEKVRLGDNLEVRCIAAAPVKSAISWHRVGDRLDNNVQTTGNVLRFYRVRDSNRGLYRCAARIGEKVYTQNYTLAPQGNDVINDSPVAETKTVPYGKPIELECKTDLQPPVSFVWHKQGGTIPKDSIMGDGKGRLVIPEVRSEDAGTYICEASAGEVKIEVPVILVVTGVLPYFPQAPNSFIVLPTLPDAIQSFNIEVSFKPEAADGMLLYNGENKNGSGDFISLGLRKGYVEFRFDVGSGPAVINSERPVSLGQWHTVNISRHMKDGALLVDEEGPYIGASPGTFQVLDLKEPLYIGGFSDFGRLHRSAGFTKGLVGCISRVKIGPAEHDLSKDAIYTRGITACETCAETPCLNRGVCQEAPNSLGYVCICPSGFSGKNCEKVGEACYEGACGSGQCVNSPEGFRCVCPFGRAGPKCEETLKINEPSFNGDSFVAYPTPRGAARRLKVSLRFAPLDLSDGIIFYLGENYAGTGNFASLAIKNRRVEFRFDDGDGVRIMRGEEDLVAGQWLNITALRDQREARLQQNQGVPVFAQSSSNVLNLKTTLFVGGVNNDNVIINSGVGVDRGFKGCISKIEVSSLDIQLNRGDQVVDSANIEDCTSITADNPCRRQNPCQNGGTCREGPEGRYSCSCVSGFRGYHCEYEPDLCEILQPCKNNGECYASSPSSYKCTCRFGFTGSTCEQTMDIAQSVAFDGNGYLELPEHLLKDVDDVQRIAMDFSTNGGDGLILWQGEQEAGRVNDYLAVAIVQGHLEFSYELGSGPTYVRSEQQLSPGRRYKARLIRGAKQASLTLDGITQSGASAGAHTTLNAKGSVFIGGVPDFNSVTSGRFLSGFDGCIHGLEFSGMPVNFTKLAITHLGVKECAKFDNLDVNNVDENGDVAN